MDSLIVRWSKGLAGSPTTRRDAMGWMGRSATVLAGAGAALAGLPKLALAFGDCTTQSDCSCISSNNGTATDIADCSCFPNTNFCSGPCGCQSVSSCTGGLPYAMCCSAYGAYCTGVPCSGGCTNSAFCTTCNGTAPIRVAPAVAHR